MATPRRISDIKPLFNNLAQTNQYQVTFGGLSSELQSYLLKRGVDPLFIGDSVGLLVQSTVLPTTSFATAQVDDSFMGVSEKFAHTRQFSEINMEVYVDKEYKTLKFFEHWMEFIASGTHNPIDVPQQNRKPIVPLSRKNYTYRMQYPNYYKCDRTKIVKFNRDYNSANEIQYTYLGLFPSSMNSVAVNYSQASIMTVSVNFVFDRYYAGNPDSLAEATNTDNNKQSSQPDKNKSDNLFNAANLDADTITSLYKNGSKTLFDSPPIAPNYSQSGTIVAQSTSSTSSSFRLY